MFREQFIQAIRDKRKVRIKFFSQEDGTTLTRVCAPMDFGPGKKIREKNDRYWVWDYESDKAMHTLGIRPERMRDMVVLDDHFEPSEFVSWTTDWIIPRDWGTYS